MEKRNWKMIEASEDRMRKTSLEKIDGFPSKEYLLITVTLKAIKWSFNSAALILFSLFIY